MTIQRISPSTTPVPLQAMENLSGNILFRIQSLVCRINTQLSRLSQETQSRSQIMKKEYRVSSEKSADLQYRIGTISPISSAIALLGAGAAGFASLPFNDTQKAFLGSFLDNMTTLQPLFGFSKEFTPSIGIFYSSKLQSEKERETSISSLRQTEIQNESNKSGEARDLQQELQQILGNIRELFKKASS